MKKLNVTFDGIHDDTGFLHSFAKSLACAVQHSPWPEATEDIIATSGFAFRMWAREDLCSSATSIWDWGNKKPWVESGGFACGYVGRYWGQKKLEKEKRLEAIEMTKQSIDRGIPAVCWNVGIPEWGLLIGYDDKAKTFAALSPCQGQKECEIPYKKLGNGELPILSVLTLSGKSEKPREDILRDTMRLAVTHLEGNDRDAPGCIQIQGLAVYPALTGRFEADDPEFALCWNMGYLLGTYGALKYYAWKYFEKMGQVELASLYQVVYEAWIEAFRLKTNEDVGKSEVRREIAVHLREAWEKEQRALALLVKENEND